MATVGRSELTNAAANRPPFLGVAHTRELLDQLLDEIIEGLARGEKVKLPGFGVFVPLWSEKTFPNAPTPPARRRVVRFRPSARLLDLVKDATP